MSKQLGSRQPQQINHCTKKAYMGQNQRTLSKAQSQLKFTSNEWMTLLQANSCGLQVRSGMQGTQIFRIIENMDTDPDTKKPVMQRGVKKYTVFNLDQCQKEASYTINNNQLASGARPVIQLPGRTN